VILTRNLAFEAAKVGKSDWHCQTQQWHQVSVAVDPATICSKLLSAEYLFAVILSLRFRDFHIGARIEAKRRPTLNNVIVQITNNLIALAMHQYSFLPIFSPHRHS
jgi:hypothetical protein